MHPLVREHLDDLRDLCVKHRVKSLSLFGSAASDEFRPEESDLDFLVEFEPQQRLGFHDVYFRLAEDLECLFGRPVDLVEHHVVERSHNPYRRERVLSTQVHLYAA